MWSNQNNKFSGIGETPGVDWDLSEFGGDVSFFTLGWNLNQCSTSQNCFKVLRDRSLLREDNI
jgi:hypothetical protein